MLKKYLFSFIIILQAFHLSAQRLVNQMSSTNGTVYAVLKNEGKYYIGGDFNYVGLQTGSGALFPTTSDIPDMSFPAIGSSVNCAISDGNSGWYIGGSFTEVDDKIVSRLIHLKADKTYDSTFNVAINNDVNSLYLKGNTLYAGGKFTEVNNSTRNYIVGVDKTTGALIPWNPDIKPNMFYRISALAGKGDYLYMGGYFDTIAGRSQPSFASFKISTGEIVKGMAFIQGVVNSVLLKGDTVFIGGYFSYSGIKNNYITSFTGKKDIPDSNLPLFENLPPANGLINSIIPDGTGGYFVGGKFSSVDGFPRQNIAKIKANMKVDTAFIATCNDEVNAILHLGSKLYFAGKFSSVNNKPQSYIALVNTTSGMLDTTWNPIFNGPVLTLEAIDTCIYAGGSFSKVNNIPQYSLTRLGKIRGNIVQGLIGTDGVVNKILAKGDSIFLGGYFYRTGYTNSFISRVNVNTGVAESNFPMADGPVHVIISDGGGGWYVGGDFQKIGDVNRSRLAHIKADLSIDLSFHVSVNQTVKTIIRRGKLLYIGGAFTSVNSVSRNYLAAVNTINSSVDFWNPNANGVVNTMLFKDSAFYVGGDFTMIGTKSRNHFAFVGIGGLTTYVTPDYNGAVNNIALKGDSLFVAGNYSYAGFLKSGNAFFQNFSNFPSEDFPAANDDVHCIIPDGSGGYFIAGSFGKIGGVNQPYLAQINSAKKIVTTFTPLIDGPVTSMLLSGNTLYISGFFNSTNGIPRKYISAIQAYGTGANATWNSTINSPVVSLTTDGTSLYAGGNFTLVNGTTIRNRLAKFNMQGVLDPIWNPTANKTVISIIYYQGDIYAGGYFDTIGVAQQPYIVKLNRSNASVIPWITVNAEVMNLLVNGTNMFLGGYFSEVNNVPRNKLASVNIVTGTLNSFAPNISQYYVSPMAVRGNILYIGGGFSSINNIPCNNLAAFDLNTSTLLNWDPDPDYSVSCLLPIGNGIFAGGSFNAFHGGARKQISIFNCSSKRMLKWNPLNGGTINDMALNNDHLYIAGYDLDIGGTLNGSIASFNLHTGSLEPWNPLVRSGSFRGMINNIYVDNDDIYLSGVFDSINGVSMAKFANFSAANGSLKPLDLRCEQEVITMLKDGNNLVVGGKFHYLDLYESYFCGMTLHSTGKNGKFHPKLAGPVYDIAKNSTRLFFAGKFEGASSQQRFNAASYNFSDGLLNNWAPKILYDTLASRASLYSIAANDSEVYLGGYFNRTGNETRNYLSKVDATNGNVLPWIPEPDNQVLEICLNSNKTLIGGKFISLKFKRRDDLFLINGITGAPGEWNPKLFGEINSLSLTNNYLYVGGKFSYVDTVIRRGAASFSLNNLSLSTWDPRLTDTIPPISSPALTCIYAYSNNVYLSGDFTNAGQGASVRKYFAVVDPLTAALKPWNPKPEYPARTVLKTGTDLFIGGSFSFMKGDRRYSLAQIDSVTGVITDWNPSPDFWVLCLAAKDSNIFVGGNYHNIGGVAKHALSAINKYTGIPSALNYDLKSGTATGIAYDLEFDANNNLYIAGNFNNVNGITRNNLASCTLNGTVRGWNPNASNMAYSIALTNNTVYVGGRFTGMNGIANSRQFLVALDTSIGNMKPFDPHPNGMIEKLYSNGTNLFVLGQYNIISGTSRGAGASYLISNDSLQGWDPQALQLYAGASIADTLFYAGLFTSTAGIPRNNFASVSTTTNTITTFNPNPDAYVADMKLFGNELLVGGSFKKISGKPKRGFAVYRLSSFLAPNSHSGIRNTEDLFRKNEDNVYVYPNPANDQLNIYSENGFAGHSKFTMMDLQGKIVYQSTSFDSQNNLLTIETSALKAGLYILMIESQDKVITKKLSIVH